MLVLFVNKKKLYF